MALIHSTDQYKIFEEEISLEDSSDVSRVLSIEYEGGKQVVLTFAFGRLVSKASKNEKWLHLKGKDKNKRA